GRREARGWHARRSQRATRRGTTRVARYSRTGTDGFAARPNQLRRAPGTRRTADLLRAAQQLEHVDLGLARETHADALFAAMVDGTFGAGIERAAESASRAPPSVAAPGAADLVLDGLMRIAADDQAGIGALHRALAQTDDSFWRLRIMMAAAFSLE